MNKRTDLDISLIGLPQIDDHTPSEDQNSGRSLYAKELEAYAEFDHQDDEALERKVRHAFLARELQQIDDIVTSRKRYANKIYWLVVCWLVTMGVLILLDGFSAKTGFDIDTKIILAIIGGTTINVLGIFTIVTNFLFPKNGHSIFSRSDLLNQKKKSTKDRSRKQDVAKSNGDSGEK